LVEVDESEVEFRIAGEDGFDFDFVGWEEIQMRHEIFEVIVVQLVGMIEGMLTIEWEKF
jgi:hypothetical protein